MQRQTKQTQAKQNERTLKVSQIDSQLFSLEKYEDNDFAAKSSQKYGFIRYDGKTTYFQTPELVLKNYGIPKFNEQYHKDQDDRSLKIPLDETHPGGKLMLEKFRELDEYFKGKQESFFGKTAGMYEYTPLVREPVIDEEAEQEKKNDTKSKYPPLPKLPFLKLKFDIDYTSKEMKSRLSLVDDQDQITEPVIQHVDDIAQHLRLNSEYRLVLAFSKHWSQKKALNGKKLWGISLKVRRVRVKARPVLQQSGPQDDFLDSDSEENDVQQFKSKQEVKQEVKQDEEPEQLETGEGEDELETGEDVDDEPDLEIIEAKKPVMTKKEDSPKKAKPMSKAKTTSKKTSKLDV
jgi:hypothetical protein